MGVGHLRYPLPQVSATLSSLPQVGGVKYLRTWWPQAIWTIVDPALGGVVSTRPRILDGYVL